MVSMPLRIACGMLAVVVAMGRTRIADDDAGVRRVGKRTRFHVSADGKAQGFVEAIRRQVSKPVSPRMSLSRLDASETRPAVRKTPRWRDTELSSYRPSGNFTENLYTAALHSSMVYSVAYVFGGIAHVLRDDSNHTMWLQSEGFKPRRHAFLLSGILVIISSLCCACALSRQSRPLYRSRDLRGSQRRSGEAAPELTPEEREEPEEVSPEALADFVVNLTDQKESSIFSNHLWKLHQGCDTAEELHNRENWRERQVWISMSGELYYYSEANQRDQKFFDDPLNDLIITELPQDATCFAFAVSVETASKDRCVKLASERKKITSDFLSACAGQQR